MYYSRDRELVVGATVIGVIITLISVALIVLYKREREYVVRSTSWNCRHELQKIVVEHDEGWNLPAGAFNVKSETRQHGFHDCEPYTCLASLGPAAGVTYTRPGGGHTYSHPTHHAPPPRPKVHTTPIRPTTTYRVPAAHTRHSTDVHVDEPMTRTCYHRCPSYDTWYTYDQKVWRPFRVAEEGGASARDAVCQPLVLTLEAEQRQVTTFTGNVRFADPNNEIDFCDFRVSSIPAFKGYPVNAKWRIVKDLIGNACSPKGLVDPGTSEKPAEREF